MDEEVRPYIFPMSHFLPYIDAEESIARMKETMLVAMEPPLLAVTYETLQLGGYRIAKQRNNFAELEWTYGTKREDLIDYIFGYGSPCYLIMAGQLLGAAGLSATIDAVSPPRDNQMDRDFRTYLTRHIFTAHEIFKKSDPLKPDETAQAIYEICAASPFINSLYYRIGHTASETVSAGLCNLIKF